MRSTQSRERAVSLPRGGVCRRLFLLLGLLFSTSAPALEDLAWEEVGRIPHDPRAFTQGLVYGAGALWESTGRWGHSSLRRIDPVEGRVLKRVGLPSRLFGEGLALVGERLYQLTWRSGEGRIYDLKLRLRGTFSLAPLREGWGIAWDGRVLLVSDGSHRLHRLDPLTWRWGEALEVTEAGIPLDRLNELEVVAGRILANVWKRDRIAVIEPSRGVVNGWIDLGSLAEEARKEGGGVLNGIAWWPASENPRGEGILVVTGKNWPWMALLRVPALQSRQPPVP